MYLPPCGTYPTCPKCGALDVAIFTVYHAEPLRPSSVMIGTPDPCTLLVVETPGEELEGFGEHLCRRCSRCGFGWSEQVASERSPYQEPAEGPGDDEEYVHCGCDHHGDHAGCDDSCEMRGCAG